MVFRFLFPVASRNQLGIVLWQSWHAISICRHVPAGLMMMVAEHLGVQKGFSNVSYSVDKDFYVVVMPYQENFVSGSYQITIVDSVDPAPPPRTTTPPTQPPTTTPAPTPLPTTPPPPTVPSCGASGDYCRNNNDCCSGSCRRWRRRCR